LTIEIASGTDFEIDFRNTKMNTKEKDIVKSVDKALTLLDHLSSLTDGANLSIISKHLGLNITSVHRMLMTMKQRGFVTQDNDTKKYHLGLRAKLLGSSAVSPTEVFKCGRRYLEQLSEITNETANLVIRDYWEAVYIMQVESRSSLRVANQVGTRVALYCTAAGKVLLAHMSKGDRLNYYKSVKLERLTPNTRCSKKDLEDEVKLIRATGLAYDREEQAIGEACIASPVFNHSGRVVAAISISSPAARLTSGKMKRYSVPIKKLTSELSTELGFASATPQKQSSEVAIAEI
jgi:DNA-binding IclR family transcriptional regulator